MRSVPSRRGLYVATSPAGLRPARLRDRARVLDSDRGRVNANVGLSSAYGPFDGVFVSGCARILDGVAYIPEPDKKRLSAGDPAVFAVIDTAAWPTRSCSRPDAAREPAVTSTVSGQPQHVGALAGRERRDLHAMGARAASA